MSRISDRTCLPRHPSISGSVMGKEDTARRDVSGSSRGFCPRLARHAHALLQRTDTPLTRHPTHVTKQRSPRPGYEATPSLPAAPAGGGQRAPGGRAVRWRLLLPAARRLACDCFLSTSFYFPARALSSRRRRIERLPQLLMYGPTGVKPAIVILSKGCTR